jgi:hypothetical protein
LARVVSEGISENCPDDIPKKLDAQDQTQNALFSYLAANLAKLPNSQKMGFYGVGGSIPSRATSRLEALIFLGYSVTEGFCSIGVRRIFRRKEFKLRVLRKWLR